MATHNEFGKLGEQKAVSYLEGDGYEIMAQNYRYLHAEIDIIARKGKIVAIVEVKSRNKGFLEDISTVINPKKVRLLTMAANQFVQERDLDLEVRFDMVKVIKSPEKTEIEHIENAFYHF